jgi:hypothetical protein
MTIRLISNIACVIVPWIGFGIYHFLKMRKLDEEIKRWHLINSKNL